MFGLLQNRKKNITTTAKKREFNTLPPAYVRALPVFRERRVGRLSPVLAEGERGFPGRLLANLRRSPEQPRERVLLPRAGSGGGSSVHVSVPAGPRARPDALCPRRALGAPAGPRLGAPSPAAGGRRHARPGAAPRAGPGRAPWGGRELGRVPLICSC